MPSFLDDRCVLVVEDEEAVRFYLREMLSPMGAAVQVWEAPNGQVALEMIEKKLPDLIICDLKMPVMDGYEFLTRLRARTDTATIPVLVITAYAEVDTEIDVLDSGANDFMGKPISRLELLARVRSLLRTKATFEKLSRQVTSHKKVIRKLVEAMAQELGRERTHGILKELGIEH